MLRPFLLVSAMLLLGFALLPRTTVAALSQDAAADSKNPVKPTAESQARAKKQWGYECEMCHGTNGDGQTDLGKDMKLTDLSDPKTLAAKSDKELFDLIKAGKGQMSGEGDRMKTDEIWNLVHYLRGLAKKG